MNIVKDKKLIPEKDWIKNIGLLKKEVREIIKGKKKAMRIVKDVFVKAVKKSFLDKKEYEQKELSRTKRLFRIFKRDEKVGILFSGGIDSTLIAFLAKKYRKNFVCYSVGMKGADDLKWAKKVAKEYKFKLKLIELDLDGFEEVVRKVTKILGESDVVKIGVGAALYPGMERAKKDGLRYVYSGLGSEEIFAGYQRHEESKDINKECWNGLKKMWQRDFTRDFLLAENLDLKWKLPFLDDELIVAAMGIDSTLKMDGDYKKIILRHVAEELKLKKEFCWRKKKAAQYGSKADKAIAKLAKRNGFKSKKDYVESLL